MTGFEPGSVQSTVLQTLSKAVIFNQTEVKSRHFGAIREVFGIFEGYLILM